MPANLRALQRKWKLLPELALWLLTTATELTSSSFSLSNPLEQGFLPLSLLFLLSSFSLSFLLSPEPLLNHPHCSVGGRTREQSMRE